MHHVMITKISIIQPEPSGYQRVEHSPNPSLSCDMDSLLGFLRGAASLLFDHAYQFAVLNLG